MPVIPWPTNLIPTDVEFWLEHHSSVFESGFSRSVQVLDMGIPRWRGKARFIKGGRNGWAMDAMLAKIAGPQNLVLLWNFSRWRTLSGGHADWAANDPVARTQQPWADGEWFFDGSVETGWLVEGRPTVTTAAAPQWATSISVDGLRPFGTYHAGEHFGASDGRHERLYMLVEDATADANGQAVFEFRPGLRGPLPRGSAINLTRPTCPFRLVDDQQARNAMRPPGMDALAEHEFEFVEDLTELP